MFRSSVKLAFAALCLLPVADAACASEHENALFGYTHLLPSPYTMKAGRVVIGTDAAVGTTDFLQLSTNLIFDFYKVFNAQAKASIFDSQAFAAALTFGWESYNFKDIAVGNPDIQVTALLPGVIVAVEPLPGLAWFNGGNLNYTSTEINTNGLVTSGYIAGAKLESDLSWAYNPRKKKMGNVLSGGVSFDLNYSILGVGISHHWPGLHLGFHYYPNASQYRVLPILVGSAAIDL